MSTYFLLNEYIASALIKAKQEFFNESFITLSEFNQFQCFMQKEFNNRNVNVVISSNSLSCEDFNITSEVITQSEKCCFYLEKLPINISMILNDKSLISKFFISFESEKLKNLEKKQTTINSNMKI